MYTPYEGLDWAYQKSRRKCGYLAGSWRDVTPQFIVILTSVRENVVQLMSLNTMN